MFSSPVSYLKCKEKKTSQFTLTFFLAFTPFPLIIYWLILFRRLFKKKKNVKEAHLVQHVEFLSRTMLSAKRTLRQVALLHTSSPVCRGGGALTGEAESGGGCP